ncbi:MAG: polyprenyl synthetase family protein [Wenzhouxiangellaceae bacterium]|nr:polyprenyl synthetase family protein [Wenzhouxiangellaceae bacterium]
MTFSETIDPLVRRVESTLDLWLPDETETPAHLHRAMRYAVFNGGKRIRPLLVYAAAVALDRESDEVDVRIDAMAAAVELIHCYSLVHDDLPAMDDDDLRRGQPTVHVAFDEATAILAGDALLTLAFNGMARTGVPGEAIAVLAGAAGSRGMVGGQAMDLAFEATRPSREMLETMFRKKTGALIRAAVEMPAAGSLPTGDPTRAALVEYAGAIGLAFQIVDDLLDIEGSTEEIGKPAGSDSVRGKATWPALFGVGRARRDAEAVIETAWAALARLPGDTSGLRWLGERIVRRRS